MTVGEAEKKRGRDEEKAKDDAEEKEKDDVRSALNQKMRDQVRCGRDDCNKKLKLTDLKCRCDLRFCGMHRNPEAHDCVFDYQADGKRVLEVRHDEDGQ